MIGVLTNKHLIVALIVAPILAILAYYAADAYVSEKPHKAVEGGSYPLVAKSNCRYESGKCTLNNGDIEITLVSNKSVDNQLAIHLHSSLPLQGAKIAFTDNNAQPFPETMISMNNEQTEWQISIADTIKDNTLLHIALAVNDTFYYGESGTVFTHYATGFSRENITQQ